MTKKD
jgi:hypothetical protein